MGTLGIGPSTQFGGPNWLAAMLAEARAFRAPGPARNRTGQFVGHGGYAIGGLDDLRHATKVLASCDHASKGCLGYRHEANGSLKLDCRKVLL
jgi:hypothetical protein